MPIFTDVCITGHTTSSTPYPHILYILTVTQENGNRQEVFRRYSEFKVLHASLRDPFLLPARRALTNLVPSAWVNDELIAERKEGLALYLHSILQCAVIQDHPILVQFLTPGPFAPFGTPQIERDVPTVWMESKSLASVTVNPSHDLPFKSDPNQECAEMVTSAVPLAGAYYPAWAVDTFPPENIAFSKYDIIFFAFITPNGVAGINWENESKSALRRLVTAARSGTNTTRVVISMGGWSGCYWMSQAVSTSSNRTKLCDAIVGIIKEFGLDGVDIDWEYPNDTGSGNPHSPADSANLLSLIKLLRDMLGSTRLICAAVTHLPWKGADGKPLVDVSEFAKYMNFVNIMNYDVFIASDPPGPNAPLDNRCGTSSQPEANARAAFAQWTKAGMPASKLLLGLPLYGYVSHSSAKKLSGSSVPVHGGSMIPVNAHPRSPIWSPGAGMTPAGDLSRLWGEQISFSQLLSSGALRKKSDGTYDGVNGYTMGWDDCSDTPYLFNQARTTVVTYDDTWSLFDKAKFAKEAGMGGCFTWSLDQDDGVTLQNAILAGLGRAAKPKNTQL